MVRPNDPFTVEYCPVCKTFTEAKYIDHDHMNFIRECQDCFRPHSSSWIVPAKPSEVEYPASLGRLS